MSIDRDELEQRARKVIPEEDYYELCDNIDTMADDELEALIAEHNSEQTAGPAPG